ncbi:MAG: hypothetical protein ACLU9S_22620 [Oscillospiraceae bacterium]
MAMIMRYNPVGIIGMSVLFAVLRIGATGMELHAGVPGNLIGSSSPSSFFFMAGAAACAAAWQARRARNQAQREAAARLEAHHG